MTVARVRRIKDDGRFYSDLAMWCPGCELLHRVQFKGKPTDEPRVEWTFDGNLDAPTVSPSILVTAHYGGDGPDAYDRRCHSFLRAGRWEFLNDCTHEYAGQTIQLPPLPEWALTEPWSKSYEGDDDA